LLRHLIIVSLKIFAQALYYDDSSLISFNYINFLDEIENAQRERYM